MKFFNKRIFNISLRAYLYFTMSMINIALVLYVFFGILTNLYEVNSYVTLLTSGLIIFMYVWNLRIIKQHHLQN